MMSFDKNNVLKPKTVDFNNFNVLVHFQTAINIGLTRYRIHIIWILSLRISSFTVFRDEWLVWSSLPLFFLIFDLPTVRFFFKQYIQCQSCKILDICAPIFVKLYWLWNLWWKFKFKTLSFVQICPQNCWSNLENVILFWFEKLLFLHWFGA